MKFLAEVIIRDLYINIKKYKNESISFQTASLLQQVVTEFVEVLSYRKLKFSKSKDCSGV